LIWLDACAGNPAADVCRSYDLLRHAASPDFARDYVQAYAATAKMKTDDIFAWLSPMAAARLAEDVSAEIDDLLSLARVT
jgi:hypothetical protein